MTIKDNISLKPYNTFGIDVSAKHFVSIGEINDLKEILASDTYPNKFILGGGSNMLLTQNIDALVMHINLKGISIESQSNSEVKVTANAGEIGMNLYYGV